MHTTVFKQVSWWFLTPNLIKGLDTSYPKDHCNCINKVSSKCQPLVLPCYETSQLPWVKNTCHGCRWRRVCLFACFVPRSYCLGTGKLPQFTPSGHRTGVGKLPGLLKTGCPERPPPFPPSAPGGKLHPKNRTSLTPHAWLTVLDSISLSPDWVASRIPLWLSLLFQMMRWIRR